MAKESFEVKQSASFQKKKYGKDGVTEITEMKFRGETSDGIKIKLVIIGPKEAIRTKFNAWPLAVGNDAKVILSTQQTQSSLTKDLIKASSKEKTNVNSEESEESEESGNDIGEIEDSDQALESLNQEVETALGE